MHKRLHLFALTSFALATAAVLSGCSTSTTAPVSTVKAVATVETPAIRSAGELTVCTTNLGSPPNVSTDEGGTLIGSEIDIAKGLAERLGLKPAFVTVDFAALIPSLQAGQCDVIMSSLYIKPEREEVVDFVPYLTSASGVAVKAGDDKGIKGLDDSLCGKKVMVTVGTTAQSLADTQSATCTGEGKKIDAYMDTAELIGYYEKQGTAGIKLVGEPTDSVNIGAATIKGNTELHDGIQAAFDDLVSSGDYTKILDSWGQGSVALKAQN
jgi:polar amino acid transport system substrate-binding protein